MNSDSLLLIFDFGGTKLTAAALRAKDLEGGRWLGLERVFSEHAAIRDQAAMFKLGRGLLERFSGKLAAVGVSFGGLVDASAGIVRLSHHVPGWENVALAGLIQREFQVPAAIENDANLGGLGEWRLGAGRGCRSLLYGTISTGIGGGWIINGKIWSGADGLAGELGHTVIRSGGEVCTCGKRGCVEAEAAGPAIARKMRRRVGENPSAEFTGESVARAAQAGETPAQEVLDDAAAALGAGLAAAINLMNPERIVLGGGVAKSGERWWAKVRSTARALTLPGMRVELAPAALGDDAPLWGAAVLARELGVQGPDSTP